MTTERPIADKLCAAPTSMNNYSAVTSSHTQYATKDGTAESSQTRPLSSFDVESRRPVKCRAGYAIELEELCVGGSTTATVASSSRVGPVWPARDVGSDPVSSTDGEPVFCCSRCALLSTTSASASVSASLCLQESLTPAGHIWRNTCQSTPTSNPFVHT